MGSLRFVPALGEWTVLAAWPTVVTISAAAPDEVVTSIWNALSAADASIEAVVSSIPIRTTAAQVPFSVVRFEPGPGVVVDPAHPPSEWTATVVVRGTAVVDLLSVGGSRRFGSQGVQPWALAEFPSVTGVSTGALPPVPESVLRVPADARRLDHGVAQASSMLWAASVELLVDANGHGVSDDTAEHLAHDPDTADGDTVLSRPFFSDTDSSSPVGESAVEESPDAASRTIEESPDAPSRSEGAAAVFELRVGERAPFELTAPVVIGRRPQPRRSTNAQNQVLITVESPAHEVSANHVEIARSGRTVVVTDLRSMNGTKVFLPGRPVVRLRQGDSVVASGSAIVEIGDGNVIHISSRERPITGMTV
jgi:hypothetical protein